MWTGENRLIRWLEKWELLPVMVLKKSLFAGLYMHGIVRRVKVTGELVVRGELFYSLFIVPKLMSRLVILDTSRSFSMVLYILFCCLPFQVKCIFSWLSCCKAAMF